MNKIFATLFFLIAFLSLNAQQEASNWYFGNNAGIRFNDDDTTTALGDGQLATDEGCASISDNQGQLLFYTDGINVFNRNHDIMPNGGNLLGSPSSTQSAIIIPKPLDTNIYYIFTVDTPSFDQTDFGLHYYEVDMTLDNGNGNVVSETRLLQDSSEKISAVLKDCQSQSIWVITLASESGTASNPTIFNTFYAYEVTDTGINTANVVRSTFPALGITDQRGYLKFSPDGTKLACANVGSGLFLFDFDTETGIVSNPNGTQFQSLNISVNSSANRPYGIEFSPNSELLYVSSSNDFFSQTPSQNNDPSNHSSSLVQFDLTAADIQSSITILDTSLGYRSALQLAPNGKIYRSTSQTYDIGLPFLSVINSPNTVGTACDYVTNQVALSNNSRQGLPPFITSFFVETIDIINQPNIVNDELPLCSGDIYTLSAEFNPDATYTWYFNDVEQATPPIPNEFEVTQNGVYKVLIELNNGDCETSEGIAIVEYFTNPEAFALPISDAVIAVCDDNGNDGLFRFTDFDDVNDDILGPSQNPLDFDIKYFLSFDDANSGRDEITFPFTNDTNGQEIFVRVENASNRNCFTTSDTNTGQILSFFLEVYDTPTISILEDIEFCDTEGDTTDGIVTIDLLALNADVLGTSQDPADFTVSYHGSQMDAENNTGFLPNNYNNVPFADEVFVRVENNANPECFTIDSFTLTINQTPEANDANIFQCDQDGIPDGLTVFNISEIDTIVTSNLTDNSINYYINMADAMAETGAIDPTNFNNTSNPQIIIARVNNLASTCFSVSEVTLEVSATSANDAVLGVCDTDGVEDGFTEFDLSLVDADVLLGLPTGLDLAYYETLDDALLETNVLPNTYANTTAFNQTIFVRVENNNNCFGINEVELEVLGLPNVETEFETLYCLNTFPEKIVLTGGVINDIPNNFFYDWSTGETTKEIEVNQPGIYTVVVRSVFGCTKERTITVLASNTATITNIEVTDATDNNTVTVLVTGEGDYEYALDDPDGFYQDSNVFENVRPGIYSVFVRDRNNCGITEDMVSVIGFPKFFTPNGDSQNDFWEVKGVSSQFQPNTKILIFDKYGKLITELNPLGSGWDGTYNGNPMPSSDYWFSVTLQDGRQFSSHFALKR